MRVIKASAYLNQSRTSLRRGWIDGRAVIRGAGPTGLRSWPLDRASERAEIDRVVAAAGRGMSAVLVLEGEAGIGKTSLLDYAVDSAGELNVVRLTGIESEIGLSFAALHQLLVPFLGDLDSLPAPLRRALATAFGIRDGGPPDPFLIGLASLTLLSGVATARSLLCVIDDAQWLDQESAGVLTFVARRLQADAIGMLFAVLVPSDRPLPLNGLPKLRLSGLHPGRPASCWRRRQQARSIAKSAKESWLRRTEIRSR